MDIDPEDLPIWLSLKWKAMLLNRLDGKRETFHHSPKAPNPCLGIWPELTKGKNA
jgi:hypothetical protein